MELLSSLAASQLVLSHPMRRVVEEVDGLPPVVGRQMGVPHCHLPVAVTQQLLHNAH